VLIQDDEDVEVREARINALRNKSGLLPQHLKMLKNQKPYEDSQSWIHDTVKYKRMMFGRYGAASGVDPRKLTAQFLLKPSQNLIFF
jgi:Growth arrest and DNA-damage-inducible proteins-interacting protein 1